MFRLSSRRSHRVKLAAGALGDVPEVGGLRDGEVHGGGGGGLLAVAATHCLLVCTREKCLPLFSAKTPLTACSSVARTHIHCAERRQQTARVSRDIATVPKYHRAKVLHLYFKVLVFVLK